MAPLRLFDPDLAHLCDICSDPLDDDRVSHAQAWGHRACVEFEALMTCVCGHPIEDHEPECVECDCVHFERDDDDDD